MLKPPSNSLFREDRPEKEPTRLTVDGSTQYLAITLPDRDHPMYHEAAELLKNNRFVLEPRNRQWWLRNRHGVLTFLSEYYHELKDRFGATFTDNFTQRTKKLRFADIECQIQEHKSGDYDLQLSLQAKGTDADTLALAATSGKPYMETEKGDIVLVDKQKLSRFISAQQSLEPQKQSVPQLRYRRRVGAAELAGAQEVLEAINPNIEPPASWKAKTAALSDLSKLEKPPLDDALEKQLRLYQLLGTAWMWHLAKSGLAGILADEMGLGKTIQTLGLLSCIQKVNTSPMLVVCPAGLLDNWAHEAARFTPDLSVHIHHGAQRAGGAEVLQEQALILTSYGTLRNDQKLFAQVELAAIIADEAQHIKNRSTQNAKALRQLKAPVRFLLTGTPIENSITDLYSLFEFLLPGYLGTPEKGGDPHAHAQRIRKKVTPYILRRTKTAVAPELPPRIEQTFYVRPTPSQQKLYEETKRSCQEQFSQLALSGASDGKLRMSALSELLRLRQICVDPRLVQPDFPASESAKLSAFLELLEEIIDGGHRVLVFSQFVSALQLLRQTLSERTIPCLYLDGQTKERRQLCDTFNKDESIPVFLISLKAGGTGLNLTGADTVIHYDPWWNPAAERQATDRAHRIGQEKRVVSLKMIATGTVEEKVAQMQETKADLLDQLLEASETSTQSVSLKDLEELLT